jgi:hypothetical protein
MVMLDGELLQTSCGFGVPRYDYVGERATLITWAEAKGEDGLRAYRAEKNAGSVDGLEMGFEEAVVTD